jgi:hypothetical protein
MTQAPICILASGQSNTYGQGAGGTWDISPLVKVWNNANNLFDLSNIGTAWVNPTFGQRPFRANCNNQSVQAANYLARLTCREVRLIMTAYDGQSINKWHDGSVVGPMYLRTKAILEAAGVSRFDILVINQGSADENTPSTYPMRFGAVVDEFTADGFMTAATPIVTNETAHAPKINKVLQSIADADPRCEMAKIGHLPTNEGVHFTGPALVRAGWEAVYSLAKTQTEFHGVTPVQNMTNWVHAGPETAITVPSGVETRVPLVARYGDLSLIDAYGNFVAPIGGLWEFSATGFAYGGRSWITLHDESGEMISFLAYSGSADPTNNAPTISGQDTLNIPISGKVSLMIRQASGVTKVVTETQARANIRLTAKYLGASVVA